jgi:hypothetical protein
MLEKKKHVQTGTAQKIQLIFEGVFPSYWTNSTEYFGRKYCMVTHNVCKTNSNFTYTHFIQFSISQ